MFHAQSLPSPLSLCPCACSATNTSVSVQAEAAGTYATEYLINSAGSYSLRGRVGATLLATTYTVSISTGGIRVDKCLSTVTGWAAGQNLTAGGQVSFEITAKDKGALVLCSAIRTRMPCLQPCRTGF